MFHYAFCFQHHKEYCNIEDLGKHELSLDRTQEVIFTYTSYARDLELSKETKSALSGKKSNVSKVKVKKEEFERCKQEGKCFKCFKAGLEIKYKVSGNMSSRWINLYFISLNLVMPLEQFLSSASYLDKFTNFTTRLIMEVPVSLRKYSHIWSYISIIFSFRVTMLSRALFLSNCPFFHRKSRTFLVSIYNYSDL